MLLDWVLYGAVIAGIALLVSKKMFKENPITKPVLWSMTGAVFILNSVIMTILKQFRYDALSETFGKSIQPSNPLDISGAAVMTILFYSILKSQGKSVESENSDE